MKAQASFEFLMLIGILSLIFAILINYAGGYRFQAENLETEQQYNKICRQVKEEIKNALGTGPFYNRTFYIPSGDYNISMRNYEIKIAYCNGEVACYIPVNLSAELNNGKNTIIYNDAGISIN